MKNMLNIKKPEEIIDEIDLEELFYPPPTNDGALTLTLTSSNYYMSPLSLSACFSH
jgi:hypothetical protein